MESSLRLIEPHKNILTQLQIILMNVEKMMQLVCLQLPFNKYIDGNSVLSFCGYRKGNPLEEHINLYVVINPSSNVHGKSDELKINALVKHMDDVIEDLITTFHRDIGKYMK